MSVDASLLDGYVDRLKHVEKHVADFLKKIHGHRKAKTRNRKGYRKVYGGYGAVRRGDPGLAYGEGGVDEGRGNVGGGEGLATWGRRGGQE